MGTTWIAKTACYIKESRELIWSMIATLPSSIKTSLIHQKITIKEIANLSAKNNQYPINDPEIGIGKSEITRKETK